MIHDGEECEIEALADLWFEGWKYAHCKILPEELARQRTRASFRDRLRDCLATVRVVDRGDGPMGFSMIKGDELYQFYLAARGRGTGVAADLMADALAQFRARGVSTAWLACAIGNDRAARFYEKAGWKRAGVMTSDLETPAGIFQLHVWRFEISTMGAEDEVHANPAI